MSKSDREKLQKYRTERRQAFKKLHAAREWAVHVEHALREARETAQRLIETDIPRLEGLLPAAQETVKRLEGRVKRQFGTGKQITAKEKILQLREQITRLERSAAEDAASNARKQR